MAKDSPAAPAVQVGLGPDGQLPLPWLGDALARAGTLAGAHALLLHGPAGTGHLELALLVAQATLCEGRPADADAGGYRPCGRCASCHLVATRVHPDLMLVLPDALRVQLGWVDDEDSRLNKSDAKPSKDLRVEQVRQAIAWTQQTSGRGRGKVLVLHPADALNGPAANALLKTLEEPPGHVKFVLCTTEPEKLPITILSRCQRFDFVTVDSPAIARRLAQIVAAEGADVAPAALDVIARRAAGSMRDSQSLLEQLLGGRQGPIGVDEVHAMIGTGREERIGSLLRAIAGRDPAAAIAALDEALGGGADPGGLLWPRRGSPDTGDRCCNVRGGRRGAAGDARRLAVAIAGPCRRR